MNFPATAIARRGGQQASPAHRPERCNRCNS